MFPSFNVSHLTPLSSKLQPNESLYDQKPEEAPAKVSPPKSSTAPVGPSFPSRFEYVDNIQAAEKGTGGNQVNGHVALPTSSSFFSDYGMDNGFQKKTSSSSKVQVSLMTSIFPNISKILFYYPIIFVNSLLAIR